MRSRFFGFGLAIAIAATVAGARADLYINGVGLNGASWGSACVHTHSSTFRCADGKHGSVSFWQGQGRMKTCAVHTTWVPRTFKPARWDAEVRDSGLKCSMSWVNNNTLDIKPK